MKEAKADMEAAKQDLDLGKPVEGKGPVGRRMVGEWRRMDQGVMLHDLKDLDDLAGKIMNGVCPPHSVPFEWGRFETPAAQAGDTQRLARRCHALAPQTYETCGSLYVSLHSQPDNR